MFISAQRRSVADAGPEAARFVAAGAAAVTGGKRLRGRFCLSGWRAVEEATGPAATPPAPVIAAAAALEVFHAAALVHDDLIDNSDTRRGRPAAHRALESAHRTAGWEGDAEAFGRSAAVLLAVTPGRGPGKMRVEPDRPAKPQNSSSFMDRMNDRWDKRQEER